MLKENAGRVQPFLCCLPCQILSASQTQKLFFVDMTFYDPKHSDSIRGVLGNQNSNRPKNLGVAIDCSSQGLMYGMAGSRFCGLRAKESMPRADNSRCSRLHYVTHQHHLLSHSSISSGPRLKPAPRCLRLWGNFQQPSELRRCPARPCCCWVNGRRNTLQVLVVSAKCFQSQRQETHICDIY